MYKLGSRKHSPVRHMLNQPTFKINFFCISIVLFHDQTLMTYTVFTMFIKIMFASWVKADIHGYTHQHWFLSVHKCRFLPEKIAWEIAYLLFHTYQHFTQGLWKCTQTSYPGLSRSAVIPQNCNTGLLLLLLRCLFNCFELSPSNCCHIWIVSLQQLSYLGPLRPVTVSLCHFSQDGVHYLVHNWERNGSSL